MVLKSCKFAMCSSEGDKLRLASSGGKLGYIMFKGRQGAPLKIQTTEVLRVGEYNHLKISVNEGTTKCPKDDEKYITGQASRNSAVIKHRAF